MGCARLKPEGSAVAGRIDSRSQAVAIAKIRDAAGASEEIRAHLTQVLASLAFKGSVRSQRFLAFVVGKALEGQFQFLGERELGIEVFGRDPSFDTGRDSTVRVAAADVRNRLLRCYADLAQEPALRIELPAGSYIPEFRIAGSAPEPIIPVETVTDTHWRTVSLALGILLVCSAAWFLVSARSGRPAAGNWNSDLQELWQPFIDSRTPLLIGVGNPLFGQFENKSVYRDPMIEKWEDLQHSPNFDAVRKSVGSKEARPVYYYAAVGEVNAAFLLGQRLGPRKESISIVRSSQLLWQQMATANVLLLGPPRFFVNRMGSMPVSLEITEAADGFHVIHPRSGEQEIFPYRDQAGFFSEDGKATVLVTHAPGPAGATDIEIFASNSTFGRMGAVDAFTDPVFARTLTARMRGASAHIPRYFQVLLTVSYKGGVPTETSYVLHRELQRRSIGGE